MREIKGSEAIREAIRNEMLRDERVFLMGEDIGKLGNTFKVLDGLWEEFGSERVIESPLSEEAIAGAAVGAALAGMRPVFEIMYIDFSTLAMDHIVNRAAKIRYVSDGGFTVPMVIRTQEGGRVSVGCQHSQCLEAFFCHVPGLKVVMPSTPMDAKGLLLAAIRDEDPVIFIEHKLLYNRRGPVPEEDYEIPLGVASVRRAGNDVTLVSWSDMVHYSLDAAKELSAEGVEVEVIDLRTLVPLDEEAVLSSVRKTGRLVVSHEAVRRCGYGAEVSSIVAEREFHSLKAPIRIVAAKNTPIPFSLTRTGEGGGYGALPSLSDELKKCTDPLEEAILPQRHSIVDAVREVMKA
jgi:pyruvate dehydrogenase E1 component beta subunit